LEVDILGAMWDAAALLAQPRMLFYIFLGVCIGTMLAVIPGIGALMGMALLLPFTFALDAHTAIAFLLGALAVMTTADAIPAVLFGVPGTPGSMATVLDGYPMAKRGEAGRALGAAFASSVMGGIIGALLLLLVVPVVLPALMATTSTELLAFCILGLSMVAALSGGSMLKGLAAACLGILLAFIGQDSQTATLRWTFDSVYLSDGINILVVVLGVYAIPELADLAIQGRSIAKGRMASNQMAGGRRGIADAFRHSGIVLRASGLSTALGTLPAIGPAVIPWIVYSYTTMTTRGKSEFGKGDVRGVIAVEASNNATVGGSLLPTVALGIPGSAPMALLLGAFLLQGVAPGPHMLTKELPFTYMMAWTVVLANVVGGALAFLLAVQLARIVFVRATILVPVIASIVFIGAVQASRHWEDLAFLLAIGALGWAMKQLRWSRSPFVLAFILAPLVEQYFFISTRIHGWQWVLRPAVLVILLLTAAILAAVVVRRAMQARRSMRGGRRRAFRPVLDPQSASALLVFAVSVAAYVTASDWHFDARIMPQIAAFMAGITSLGALLFGWWEPLDGEPRGGAAAHAPEPEPEPEPVHYDVTTDFGDLDARTIARRGLRYAGFLLTFCAIAFAIGLLPAVPVFLLLYMFAAGESWRVAVPVAAGTTLFAYFVFERLLVLPWPLPLWNVLGWMS
jgi:TctA family transporter